MAPFIGILVNLYRKINKNSNESLAVTVKNKNELDNLASLFNRMDSFDPNLFKSCFIVVSCKLPATTDLESDYYKSFEQMLQEIEILV